MLKQKLKEYRIKCGFSQQQVADVLNMHRSTYSYYESGKTEPSMENIRLLAKMFGASLDDLLEMEFVSLPGLAMGDPGYDDDFAYLKEERVNRVGDLTRDEKTLILHFRLMTDRQRRELLQVLRNPGGDEPEDSERK